MLDRVTKKTKYKDNDQAQRTAKEQIEFIKANYSYFTKAAKPKDIAAFQDFLRMSNTDKKFVGGQFSYIDGMYELTMKGMGFPAVKNQKSKWGVNLKV